MNAISWYPKYMYGEDFEKEMLHLYVSRFRQIRSDARGVEMFVSKNLLSATNRLVIPP